LVEFQRKGASGWWKESGLVRKSRLFSDFLVGLNGFAVVGWSAVCARGRGVRV
jgi:hypothetical protein